MRGIGCCRKERGEGGGGRSSHRSFPISVLLLFTRRGRRSLLPSVSLLTEHEQTRMNQSRKRGFFFHRFRDGTHQMEEDRERLIDNGRVLFLAGGFFFVANNALLMIEFFRQLRIILSDFFCVCVVCLKIKCMFF
ncbi:hypothetical protein CDAR_246711 [Caerostris darwini]|uniref:Uncharacterized protein n=1 Tax=Caerostris darwini TaxID=1538125 RepID=A0AAV4TFU6_9ARAC|nr:hypothetical protein CDAR_246711 [Caerostris darwini]